MNHSTENKPSFMVDSDLEMLREVEKIEKDYEAWKIKGVSFEEAYMSFLKHVNTSK